MSTFKHSLLSFFGLKTPNETQPTLRQQPKPSDVEVASPTSNTEGLATPNERQPMLPFHYEEVSVNHQQLIQPQYDHQYVDRGRDETEEHKPDSPLTDNSVAPTPSHQPILINDGGSYSFAQKQSLKDFSGNFEIINVVSSINSNSSLSYERSSDQSDVGSNLGSSSSKKRLIESSVEPEEQLSLKEKLELVEKEIMYNSCPTDLPVHPPIKVNEGTNVSNVEMPEDTSEIEGSITESQNENELPQVPHNVAVSTKSYESESSACPSLVNDNVRDRYPTTATEVSVSKTSQNMPLETAHTDLIGLCNGKYIKPDIIPPLEPDVISHVTHLSSSPVLDGPRYKLDYSVNQPTGTIHTIHPDVLNNPDEDMDTSKTSFVTAYNKTDSFYESGHSTAPQQQLNPSTSLGIDVTLGLGPNNMYRRDDDVTTGDSIPSPCLTNKTEYLSANLESEFHSISPLPRTKDDDIDTSSPLSLLDFPETLESDYSIILAQVKQQELEQQQQPEFKKQQQQVTASIPIRSKQNEFVPFLVKSGSYTELPKYSPPEADSQIGHLSDSRTPTPPRDHDTIGPVVILPPHEIGDLDEVSSASTTPPLLITVTPQTEDNMVSIATLPPHQYGNLVEVSNTSTTPPLPTQDHDTIIIEASDVTLPPHSIGNADEVPDASYIGNDSQPLNYESIIPQRKKESEIDLPQPDNGTLLKELEFPVEPVIPLRSVESPITFSDYIAREWIGTSENAQRVRNGYTELEKLGYTHLMSIRGDNYCAIRSTLFQTFCVRDFNVCSFLADMKPPVQAKEIVAPFMDKYPFLNKWSFANKQSFLKIGDTQKVLEICVGALAYQINEVRNWEPLDRMIYIYNKLNIEPEDFDFTLMEALKFYMFITAAKYWELFSTGQDVPESMQFLFLREDSGNLEDFLINHLNSVGDSGGLEMVEMFLLGFTLELQIKVTRVSSFGKEDFISYYPQGEYPPERIISISAEDDRHYNALSTLQLKDADDFFIPDNNLRI